MTASEKADGSRSYLKPSKSVRDHCLCALESFHRRTSLYALDKSAQTDRQASLESAEALLGMATLSLLTLEVFVRGHV